MFAWFLNTHLKKDLDEQGMNLTVVAVFIASANQKPVLLWNLRNQTQGIKSFM